MNKPQIIKAGQIASQTREYAKSIIKKNTPLLEIAEKIEASLTRIGSVPFPQIE